MPSSIINLPCLLTDREKMSFGIVLAQKQAQIEANEDAKRASMSQFKSQNDILIAQIRELSRKIRDGFENRDVDCLEVFDWANGKVTCTRIDTGEVIWHRDIIDEERQQTIPLDETETSPMEQLARTMGLGEDSDISRHPYSQENAPSDETRHHIDTSDK